MNRKGTFSERNRWLGIATLVAILGFIAAPSVAAKGSRAGAQLEFGVQMAKRGLWNEALFRFERVLAEQPNNARLLNNIAVAYEAIGKFDQALEHYKRALAIDSNNRELRRNYAQFLEFYQGLRPETEKDAEEAASSEDDDKSVDQVDEGASY